MADAEATLERCEAGARRAQWEMRSSEAMGQGAEPRLVLPSVPGILEQTSKRISWNSTSSSPQDVWIGGSSNVHFSLLPLPNLLPQTWPRPSQRWVALCITTQTKGFLRRGEGTATDCSLLQGDGRSLSLSLAQAAES